MFVFAQGPRGDFGYTDTPRYGPGSGVNLPSGRGGSQGSPGEPRRAQEGPGEPRRRQESPGEPRRTQESPGGPGRAQESQGDPRRPQETPGESWALWVKLFASCYKVPKEKHDVQEIFKASGDAGTAEHETHVFQRQARAYVLKKNLEPDDGKEKKATMYRWKTVDCILLGISSFLGRSARHSSTPEQQTL